MELEKLPVSNKAKGPAVSEPHLRIYNQYLGYLSAAAKRHLFDGKLTGRVVYAKDKTTGRFFLVPVAEGGMRVPIAGTMYLAEFPVKLKKDERCSILLELKMAGELPVAMLSKVLR